MWPARTSQRRIRDRASSRVATKARIAAHAACRPQGPRQDAVGRQTRARRKSDLRCSLACFRLPHTVGKVPATAEVTVRRQAGLIRLRRELQEAIDQENYERAATVRDELQALESE